MAKRSAKFHVQLDSGVSGPLAGVELRELALAGKVTPHTKVALATKEKTGLNWVPAKRVKGLFDKSGSPLPPPDATDQNLASQQPRDSQDQTQPANGSPPLPDEQSQPPAGNSIDASENSQASATEDTSKSDERTKSDGEPAVANPGQAVSDPQNAIQEAVTSAAAEYEWHYEHDDEAKGPVSLAELAELAQQRVVSKDSKVWRDGLDDWVPASEVDELSPIFPVPTAKGPPPLKKSPPPLKKTTSQPVDTPVATEESKSHAESASAPTPTEGYPVSDAISKRLDSLGVGEAKSDAAHDPVGMRALADQEKRDELRRAKTVNDSHNVSGGRGKWLVGGGGALILLAIGFICWLGFINWRGNSEFVVGNSLPAQAGNPRDKLSQMVSQMGSRADAGIERSLAFKGVEGGKRSSVSNGTAIQKFGKGIFDPIATIELAVTDWDFDASRREGTIEVTELRNLTVAQQNGVKNTARRFVTTLHLEYDGQRFRLYRVRITIHVKETQGARVISDTSQGPADVPERLEVNTLAPVKVMVGDLF